MKQSGLIRDIALVLVLAATGVPSFAEQSAGGDSVWTRDKLTGDWGGLRSDLSKHGIDIDLRLSQYYQGVTSGGRDTIDEYGGTAGIVTWRPARDHPLSLSTGPGYELTEITEFKSSVNASVRGPRDANIVNLFSALRLDTVDDRVDPTRGYRVELANELERVPRYVVPLSDEEEAR